MDKPTPLGRGLSLGRLQGTVPWLDGLLVLPEQHDPPKKERREAATSLGPASAYPLYIFRICLSYLQGIMFCQALLYCAFFAILSLLKRITYYTFFAKLFFTKDQIRSVSQSCPTLYDPMNRSTPGLPVHHQLPEFTETHIHRVSDAIQPSHRLSSPSPLAPSPSQHQILFQ